MAAPVDQPLNCQQLGPPDELPANETTPGLLPRPMTLAAPNPDDVAGLLLAPIDRLSKVQAVSVVAAFAPDNDASSSEARQTMFLIFI
jgi:hypothetical protein